MALGAVGLPLCVQTSAVRPPVLSVQTMVSVTDRAWASVWPINVNSASLALMRAAVVIRLSVPMTAMACAVSVVKVTAIVTVANVLPSNAKSVIRPMTPVVEALSLCVQPTGLVVSGAWPTAIAQVSSVSVSNVSSVMWPITAAVVVTRPFVSVVRSVWAVWAMLIVMRLA